MKSLPLIILLILRMFCKSAYFDICNMTSRHNGTSQTVRLHFPSPRCSTYKHIRTLNVLFIVYIVYYLLLLISKSTFNLLQSLLLLHRL